MSPRDAVGEISPELGAIRQVRRRPKLSWSMRIGAAVLIFYVAVALISLVWTPYDPLTPGVGDGYDAPSSAFLLGTDRLGSDMLSRLMVGARYNLGITLTAVAIALSVGTTIGVIAGYHGGAIDTVVLRAVEIFQAFPGLLFAMLVVQAVGPGIVNVILVLSFVGIPDYLRLARGEIHSRRSWQYAEAARMVGNPPWRVAFRHLLPNSIGPVLAFTSINAAFVALITASLGFLGHPRSYALDATKIRRELGWAPAHSFEQGIRETVRWYLDHRAWCARIAAGAYRRERLGLGGVR